MLDQQKITIIYCRLSVEDIKEDTKNGKGNFKADESNSIQNQDGICQGFFLQKSTCSQKRYTYRREKASHCYNSRPQ